MDKDRIKGAAKNIAGKAKTAVGKANGRREAQERRSSRSSQGQGSERGRRHQRLDARGRREIAAEAVART